MIADDRGPDQRSASWRLARGIELCRGGDWDNGVSFLVEGAEQSEEKLSGLEYSYLGHGIAKVRRRVEDGLKLCEHAVKVDFCEPDNFLNLARTRLLGRDRKGAWDAVVTGLKLSPTHRELRKMAESLGRRRQPVLASLDRAHPLNRLLGRLRHGLRRGDDLY